MRLGLDALGRKVARGAPALDLDVERLVETLGCGVGGDVGDVAHELGLGTLKLVATGVELGDAVLHGSDFLAHGSGLVGTAVLHEGADLLGGAVALGLKSLDLLNHLAALLVERQEALLVPRAVALGHGGVEDLGVLTKQANVVHVVPPVVWRPLAGLQRLCPPAPKQARRSDESHNSVILALRAA